MNFEAVTIDYRDIPGEYDQFGEPEVEAVATSAGVVEIDPKSVHKITRMPTLENVYMLNLRDGKVVNVRASAEHIVPLYATLVEEGK